MVTVEDSARLSIRVGKVPVGSDGSSSGLPWWLEIGVEGRGGGRALSSKSMLLRRRGEERRRDHLLPDTLSKTTRGWRRREVRESGWHRRVGRRGSMKRLGPVGRS